MKKLLLILAMICSTSFAKDNMKIVIPQPPGGINDVFVRQVQKQINENPELDLNVIIVNKPGADGLIALNEALNDKSEYVLMFAGGAFIYKAETEEAIKTAKSMVPVMQAMTSSSTFIVEKDSKFKTWNDLVQYAKTNPVNIGTNSFIANYMLQEVLPSKNINIIPFTGDVPVLLNVRNKTLDVGIINYFSAMSQLNSKEVVALSMTHENDFQIQHVNSFHGNINLGFFAPPSMSAEKIKRMNTILASIVNNKEVREMFTNRGVFMTKNTSPEYFSRNIEKVTKK